MKTHSSNVVVALFRFICSIALIAAASPGAEACTAFRMPTSEPQILVGRNFDWDYGHGLIVINKRGVLKKAIALHPSDTATWTSQYGSLTFNQAGRELPYGGLNEKGLMIEVLWLGYTSWPATDAPSINETQWIQYQLDLRSSVADLVAHLDDVRILSVFAKVHFFVCDAGGECAMIEGAGNHLEVHTGPSLSFAALTNDPYASSVKYANRFAAPGACAKVPKSSSSLDRFARAACSSSAAVVGESLAAETERVNSALDSTAQANFTKWRIVYDLTNRVISIRTSDAPVAKSVSLSEFDFSCGTPVKILDLNTVVNSPSDVSKRFIDYTTSANRSIVEKSLVNGFAQMPRPLVERVIAFPETLACARP